ncbi:MAG: TauD/TfdA family dioxygenase [Alphaproteobacteria bacterium]|nr:TauD/TfdA family dioxygenase [Alphaproteobacteria bacterium]
MTWTETKLHPLFGAEITGLDPRDPFDDRARDALEAAFIRNAVTVIRNAVPLGDEEQIAFTGRFGPLQQMKMLNMLGRADTGKATIRMRYPELVDVGNLDEEGRILAAGDRRRAFNKGNELWHTDVSFDDNRATFSFLNAHVVPPSGADTEFADMRAAHDTLPAATKARITDLVAEHSIWYSRALGGLSEVSEAEKMTRPPAHHRLVHMRRGATRNSLYLASHASHILGMPIAEGRALLRALTEHATRPELVYRHRWRAGDLVIWDNLATMHRGTLFDDTVHRRDMRRTTVLERAA